MLGFLVDLLGATVGSALDPVLWLVAAGVTMRLRPVWFPVAALVWAVFLALLIPLPDYMAAHGHIARALSAYAILWLAYGGHVLYRRSQRAKPARVVSRPAD